MDGNKLSCGQLLVSQKGMATVEACVIIPLTLIITILLVWLGFYYYDKNVLTESAGVAAVYGAEHSDYSNKEIKEYTEEKLEECLDNKVVLIKDIDYEVTVTATEVKVSVSGVLDAPLYFTDGFLVKGVKRAPRLKPSTFVRAIIHLSDLKSK